MHSRLDDYQAEVATYLRALSAAKRDEELREMRQHLLNAIIVNRERGQSEEEAAQNAVAQFGTPPALGENIVWAWQRGIAHNRRDFWCAAACAFALSIVVPHLMILIASSSLRYVTHPHSTLLWAYGVIASWDIAGGLLVGTSAGVLFPKRAVAGAVFGMSSWVLLGTLLFIIRVSHVNWADPTYHDRAYIICVAGARSIILVCSAMLGAWAGSRRRRTRLAQR